MIKKTETDLLSWKIIIQINNAMVRQNSLRLIGHYRTKQINRMTDKLRKKNKTHNLSIFSVNFVILLTSSNDQIIVPLGNKVSG